MKINSVSASLALVAAFAMPQPVCAEAAMSPEKQQVIEQVLLETGWPRDQVGGALGAFADVTFPMPVPRPRPYLSAREADPARTFRQHLRQVGGEIEE